jgi:hypothetical protein
MDMTHDCYQPIDTPEGVVIEPCPVCNARASLWRHSEAPDAPTTTAVMCSNGERFGPQDGLVNLGCLLYMPPGDFHRGTIREAVRYWNEYALALRELSLQNLINACA